MSALFTAEQEARIAQIVADVLSNFAAQEAKTSLARRKTAIAWALHNSGFDQSEKSDD